MVHMVACSTQWQTDAFQFFPEVACSSGRPNVNGHVVSHPRNGETECLRGEFCLEPADDEKILTAANAVFQIVRS